MSIAVGAGSTPAAYAKSENYLFIYLNNFQIINWKNARVGYRCYFAKQMGVKAT